jgi:hypothetical protein
MQSTQQLELGKKLALLVNPHMRMNVWVAMWRAQALILMSLACPESSQGSLSLTGSIKEEIFL